MSRGTPRPLLLLDDFEQFLGLVFSIRNRLRNLRLNFAERFSVEDWEVLIWPHE